MNGQQAIAMERTEETRTETRCHEESDVVETLYSRAESDAEEVYEEFGEEVGGYFEDELDSFLEEVSDYGGTRLSRDGDDGYIVFEGRKDDGRTVYRRKIPVFKKWIYKDVKEKPWSFSEAGAVEEAYDIEEGEYLYTGKGF